MRKKDGGYYALSHYTKQFIRGELGLDFPSGLSGKVREALQEPASNLDKINPETIPLQDFPKAVTVVHKTIEEINSILPSLKKLA